MLCKFIQKEEGIECEFCGLYIKGDFKVGQIKKTCSKHLYPTMLEMTKNAVNAGIDFVKDGFKVSDEEESNRRLAICKECPMYVAAENRCEKCGCYLSWKSAMASSHCPIGKW